MVSTRPAAGQIVSLVIFGVGGLIAWEEAMVMMIGSMLGDALRW
jgi:hypothetical protein